MWFIQNMTQKTLLLFLVRTLWIVFQSIEVYFSPWSLTFSYQSILTCRKKRLKDEKLDVMVLKGEGIAYWDMGYHLTGHFLIVWGENIVLDCLNFGFLVTLYSLGKTLQSCERNLNNCWAETFILECFSMNFDTWLLTVKGERKFKKYLKWSVVDIFDMRYYVCICCQSYSWIWNNPLLSSSSETLNCWADKSDDDAFP